MADAVASYLPGSLCSIRIEASDDSHISIYPGFPKDLAAALEQIGIASINLAPAHPRSTSSRMTPLAPIHPVLRSVTVQTLPRNSSHAQYPIDGHDRLLVYRESSGWAYRTDLAGIVGTLASLAVERRGLYEQLSFRRNTTR